MNVEPKAQLDNARAEYPRTASNNSLHRQLGTLREDERGFVVDPLRGLKRLATPQPRFVVFIFDRRGCVPVIAFIQETAKILIN